MNEHYPVKRGWRLIPESDRRYKLFKEVYSYAKSIDVIPDNVEKPLLFGVTSSVNCGACETQAWGGRIPPLFADVICDGVPLRSVNFLRDTGMGKLMDLYVPRAKPH